MNRLYCGQGSLAIVKPHRSVEMLPFVFQTQTKLVFVMADI